MPQGPNVCVRTGNNPFVINLLRITSPLTYRARKSNNNFCRETGIKHRFTEKMRPIPQQFYCQRFIDKVSEYCNFVYIIKTNFIVSKTETMLSDNAYIFSNYYNNIVSISDKNYCYVRYCLQTGDKIFCPHYVDIMSKKATCRANYSTTGFGENR